MNVYKLILVVVTAVFVLACRSAESIPAGIYLSDYVVDQNPKTNGTNRLRKNDKATDVSGEERVGKPPNVDSYVASSSRNRMEVPNELDITNNQAFKQWMDRLGIKMKNAEDLASALKRQREYEKYNVYSLKMMILGSWIFEQLGKTKFSLKFSEEEIRRAIDGKLDPKIFDTWINDRKGSPVDFPSVYAKMLWIHLFIGSGRIKIRPDESADMAFGSEFFKANNIPLPKVTPGPGKHNRESEYELDSDIRVLEKLQMLAKDRGLSDKTQQELGELRKRARHEVMGDLLKEETSKESK